MRSTEWCDASRSHPTRSDRKRGEAGRGGSLRIRPVAIASAAKPGAAGRYASEPRRDPTADAASRYGTMVGCPTQPTRTC
jgi:hypothetical protein